MAETSEDFIYVRERRLPYETFDSDNHLYENQDALTKFLPKKYEGVIKYVDVGGRTKLALRDKISHYIPNPTFSKVAAPGSWGNTAANRGHGGVGGRTGVKPKAMPSPDCVLRSRAASRTDEGHGNRPYVAVADAGERARGASGRRSRI